MPVCEVIAVGTELLLGNIANTDARDISQGLAELGIHCYRHTTVGDNEERLRAALRAAKSCSDIIITTGGLGPTYDDITKQTVCSEFSVPLVPHEPTWERIRRFFESTGRPLTENNRRQAMVPKGGVVLENDWGTAPGCGFVTAEGLRVYMLPGPPAECVPLFRRVLMPLLRECSDIRLVSRDIRVVGRGESAVEDLLRPLMESARNPTLAPYAKQGEVSLRVTASAATEDEAFALTVPMVEQVTALLGDAVYGVDVDSLEAVVLNALRARKLRLSVAESCTGGGLAERLSRVPGASDCFAGGVVAYFTSVKTGLLGISPQTVEQNGVVSKAVAAAMAQSACRLFGTELGLGITGLAGPGGDGSNTPVGTVCLALRAEPEGRGRAVTLRLGDGRERVRGAAVVAALDMLRRWLL